MSILEAAIGWLAPPQCVVCTREGSALCVACASSEIIAYGEHCWHCGVVSIGGRTCQRCRLPGTPAHVWLATHYEGAAADLLKIYKFGHMRSAADSLAGLMTDTFYDFNAGHNYEYLVTAVPTATSRRRERSFDHSMLLARKIAINLKFESHSVLGRLGQARQLGARRAQRLQQPQGEYFVRNPGAVGGRNILLVDDVVTTGATLRAAGLALRKAGARRVDALIFAKRL